METRQSIQDRGLEGAEVTVAEDGTILCRMLDQFLLAVDPDDHGFTHHAKNEGYWEPWISAWMSRQFNDTDVFIDVGANMGYYTQFAAARDITVHAFEPQEKLCALIEKSSEYNLLPPALVRVHNMAVGASNGFIELSVPEHHGMNASITHDSYSPSGKYERYQVEMCTLDSLPFSIFAKPEGAVARTLVKIDVEGAEGDVWKGMQGMVERLKQSLTIVMEFNWSRLKDPEAVAQELLEKCWVSYIDYQSDEVHMHTVDDFTQRIYEDWMLVLRPKITHNIS